MAEALADSNNKFEDHTPWRVWAEDVPGKNGAKRYYAATIEGFGRLMREKGAGGCHFYEMIFAKDPCWAYFDLEFSRTDAAPAALDAPSPPPALNAAVNGDVMTSTVYRAAKELIEARWRAQDAPPPPKSLFFQSVALDSHRPDKFSRHLDHQGLHPRHGE